MYNMDFCDGFGVLLFFMLMLIAVVSIAMNIVYGMIAKSKWNIYRTSNIEAYNKFLSELDLEKYELINVVNHHNRKGADEYIVIYKWKKKNKTNKT